MANSIESAPDHGLDKRLSAIGRRGSAQKGGGGSVSGNGSPTNAPNVRVVERITGGTDRGREPMVFVGCEKVASGRYSCMCAGRICRAGMCSCGCELALELLANVGGPLLCCTSYCAPAERSSREY